MRDPRIVIHRGEVDYNFYSVSRTHRGDYEIREIPMPAACENHVHDLSDAVMVAFPRSVAAGVKKGELDTRIIAAYNALIPKCQPSSPDFQN